jgi:hypothetical protein
MNLSIEKLLICQPFPLTLVRGTCDVMIEALVNLVVAIVRPQKASTAK